MLAWPAAATTGLEVERTPVTPRESRLPASFDELASGSQPGRQDLLIRFKEITNHTKCLKDLPDSALVLYDRFGHSAFEHMPSGPGGVCLVIPLWLDGVDGCFF